RGVLLAGSRAGRLPGRKVGKRDRRAPKVHGREPAGAAARRFRHAVSGHGSAPPRSDRRGPATAPTGQPVDGREGAESRTRRPGSGVVGLDADSDRPPGGRRTDWKAGTRVHELTGLRSCRWRPGTRALSKEYFLFSVSNRDGGAIGLQRSATRSSG